MADAEQHVKDHSDVHVDLAEIKTDLGWIKKNLSNHLRHHWAVQIALLTFVGGLIIALLVVLI